MNDSDKLRLDRSLRRAAESRDVAAARAALDAGADPNNGLEPDSVLMSAVDGDCTFLDSPELAELIELLLSRGASPDGQIPGQVAADAPIHTAAQFGMIEAIKTLHQHGADLNRLSLEERSTALGAAESEHWFCVGARFGDDYFGEVLPAALEDLPERFRSPSRDDDNARIVRSIWGIQQVIPYLRSHGGLVEWELLPAEHSLLDAICFAPDSACRYYRPGSIKAKRNHHPIARGAFQAVSVELQDKYDAWCVEFIDPWRFGPASTKVLAFDYDNHAGRGLRLLAELMVQLAMPGLTASIGVHSSAAILAGCHLRDYYDWSWSQQAFVRERSWKDQPVRSLLHVG